jgi:DNA-binding CsgD family transcriptional regulator
VGTRRTPELIGRAQELRALLGALGETRRSGALVMVSGEAGIGKTRLLDEFGRQAEGWSVARGGCVEGVAYAPWTDVLWALLEAVEPAVVAQLPAPVRAHLARLAPQLGPAPAADGSDGQEAFFEAIVQLLTAAGRRHRLILVLDDVQWVDPASGALLRYLAFNLRRVPILLVVAYRPEDANDARDLLAQLARVSTGRMELTGLADDAATAMAAALLDGDAAAGDVARIAAEARGNPLFIEELAAGADDTVPHTLRDLLLARYRALDTDARDLVQTAALIGSRAPRAWLIAATGLDDGRAAAAARAAVDAGVLVVGDDGRSYVFRNALMRQPVLDELSAVDRTARHHAIAAALTDHPSRQVGVDVVPELARHWEAANEPAPALRWVVAAAQLAEDRYAFEEAADAFERALGWWDKTDDPDSVVAMDHAALLLAAANAAAFAGRSDRAAALGQAGVEEACAIDIARGVDAAGRMFPLMSADRAGALHASLVPGLDRVDPISRARFLVNTLEHQQGLTAAAANLVTAGHMMDAVRAVDDPELRAHAHRVMARGYELAGDVSRVAAEYDQAILIARATEAPSSLALAQLQRARFLHAVPDNPGALAALDEVDALVDQYGLRRYLVPATALRAMALTAIGEVEQAATVLAAIEPVPAEGYDAWFRAYAAALVHHAAGDADAAQARLDPAAVGAPELSDCDLAVMIAAVRADAHAAAGNFAGARVALDRGIDTLERYADPWSLGSFTIAALRVEADAAVAATDAQRLDEIELAHARAQHVTSRWHAAVAELHEQTPLTRVCSLAVAAEMARVTGDDVGAPARAVMDAANEISLPYLATYFRIREAEAVLRRGDEPGGTDRLQRARAAARLHGFAGLDKAVAALARTFQLRLGSGRALAENSDALSERELEVLRLLVDGRSNPEIAEELHISRHTARAHVSNLLRKLGTTSRVEAAAVAHRRGLV